MPDESEKSENKNNEGEVLEKVTIEIEDEVPKVMNEYKEILEQEQVEYQNVENTK